MAIHLDCSFGPTISDQSTEIDVERIQLAIQ